MGKRNPMSHVFVLDTNKRPVNPVHPGCARILLKQGKAAVYRRFPFTIILQHAVEQPVLHPLRLKIDPGSKTTGLALMSDASGEVVFAAELTHRGVQIKQAMDARRAIRHNRRQRKTRYRKPRFQNRRKRKGMLPPSLESRVATIITWVKRLIRLCPITALSQELVKFDLQRMQNPVIEGVEYQQGQLAGYEVREWLLEKWQRRCSYCGKEGVPLQVEHIQPKACGGTDRLSNLTIACDACNTAKGTQDIREFLKDKPDVLKQILAQAQEPLKDAAAINTARWALYKRLQRLGLPVECGSGGLTKYNRAMRNLPKTHWLDACCVGKSTPKTLHMERIRPLCITATGHGSRQMCRMNAFGFPCTSPKQYKRVHGFVTGDIVRAVVLSGKKVGTYTGRVAVRTLGFFNITTPQGTIQGVNHRFCAILQRCDGYRYHSQKEGGVALLPTP